MILPDDPRRLAEDLLSRSICAVQVAAVIADKHGIFSWGVNHVGFDGLGQHAEREAIRRANKLRLDGAAIYVAARRRKSGNPVLAKPCEVCTPWILTHGIRDVFYQIKNGSWLTERLY